MIPKRIEPRCSIWVHIAYRIISTVGVDVEAVDCFGVKVAYVVGVDETSRFGVGRQVIAGSTTSCLRRSSNHGNGMG